jgi:hypothetical protein
VKFRRRNPPAFVNILSAKPEDDKKTPQRVPSSKETPSWIGLLILR